MLIFCVTPSWSSAQGVMLAKKVVIVFHLYNLDLMDEFIDRINKFMKINSSENFHIKITVPIDSNVRSFRAFDAQEHLLVDKKDILYRYCVKKAIYHPHVITRSNCTKLFVIDQYLINNLALGPDRIQIIFSENRGVDVGSFLLMLDQIIQENLPHDYIVKIHTKTDSKWRGKLLQILDFNFSQNIKNYEYVYACHRFLAKNHSIAREKNAYNMVAPRVKKILSVFRLKCPDAMSHSAGTMFIVSDKLTTFFKKFNRIKLYKMLNMGFPKCRGPLLEHGLEVALGYLCEYLQLKPCALSDFLGDKVC